MREVFPANHSIGRAEDSRFKDTGEFARVGGPIMLQQAGCSSGRQTEPAEVDSAR